jgi:hypothetical protein
MNSNHIEIFQKAADKFVCQIVVREVNEFSGRWLQHPREYPCFPKPVTCCAKTADKDHHLAGLVVDPTVFPDAFLEPWKANQNWLKFVRSPGFKKYRVLETGPFKGAVLLRDFSDQQSRYRPVGGESLVHADYDLLAVHKMRKTKDGYQLDRQHLRLPHGAGPHMNKNNLAVQTNRDLLKVVNLEFSVQQFVNSQINVPMIQHGAESTYGDFGGRDKEEIYIFPPGLVKHQMGRSFCSNNYLNAVNDEGESFVLWKVRNQDEVVSYRSPHSS